MRFWLSLKYEHQIDSHGANLVCVKKHLPSQTPSRMAGYGGYGWLLTISGRFKYVLHRGGEVFSKGSFRDSLILCPNGGKPEDYWVVISEIDRDQII
jgi:hypothetical protein